MVEYFVVVLVGPECDCYVRKMSGVSVPSKGDACSWQIDTEWRLFGDVRGVQWYDGVPFLIFDDRELQCHDHNVQEILRMGGFKFDNSYWNLEVY